MLIKGFDDFIEKANAATTEEDLFSVYLKAVNNHGLDRALFALITDHKDLKKKSGIGIIHNFPSDWMSHYFEKGYDKIDPVVVYGASQVAAYTWEEIPKKLDLSKSQVRCLNYGAEAGLNKGVATYLRNERNQVAGISLASSEKKDSFDGKIHHITAYSNHFYNRYREINKIEGPEPINFALSEKEREVLLWAAASKTDHEIAIIMNVTIHAVDYHMRNIFRKLQTNNRVLAVVRAMSYGLINPA